MASAQAQANDRRTEGERWTGDELRRLHERRFSPAAVASFLAAAQGRANETRRARPQLAAQSRRWSGIGALAWIGLASAGIQPFRRRWPQGLAWWAAVALMLDWHLGMLETEHGEPRQLGAADAITLGRAWLVPVIADELHPAAVLAAAIGDGLDGLVARAGEPTRAGRDLDGVVDGCVLVAALSAAQRNGRISRPVVALEATRLGAGVGVALGTYLLRHRAPATQLTGAARSVAPLRFAGLAAAGRRPSALADTLLAAGSAASLGAAVAATLNSVKQPAG